MRISSADRYDSTISSLSQRQRDMSESQLAMSNGKRINKPSDDPIAAARAERAYLTQQRIVSGQRSVDASRNAMVLAESAIGQASEVLQRARETVVASGNGSYSASERAAQAAQLGQYRDQLLGLANQGDGASGYLFGGQGATAEPFLDVPGGVRPTAAGGQNQLSATDRMPSTVDGNAIWLGVASGNGVFVSAPAAGNSGSGWIDAGSVSDPSAITGAAYRIGISISGGGGGGTGGTSARYTVFKDGNATAQANLPLVPGASISVDGMTVHIKGLPADGDSFTLAPSKPDLDAFAALDRAITQLKNPQANAGQVAQAVNSGLRDIDAVLGRMQSARAEVGSTLTRLDAIDGRNQDRNVWAKSVQANAEDLDMVQAISSFQNQQTGYQAALQSYAAVHRMSLFDYIK